MDYTQKLKLSKPSYDDDVDIKIINTNMDIIDNNIDKLDKVDKIIDNNIDKLDKVDNQIKDAIKAISGMSAYNIAPSKTIATMILLLGFGGIVAQRLENTGYVKFANGLTFQWGSETNVPTGTQINFPILFDNGICKVVCIGKENNNRNAIQYFSTHSVTGAGFKVLSKRFDGAITNDFFDWIAVGF